MSSDGTNAPFGLKPWGNVLRANYYAIVTAYGTAIYHGESMGSTNTSLATPHMGYLMGAEIDNAGAAGDHLGAVLAIFDHNMDPVMYLPASSTGNGTIAGYVLVADHPQQTFIIQEDGDTTPVAAASIGLNADMASGTGSTSTGLAASTLDSDSVNTTNTLLLRVVGVHPDDTPGTIYCRFIVIINPNAHLWASATAI